MLLALSTGEESDAKEKCLLDDEYEHTGQHEVSVAACGIEYRHLGKVKRFCCYLCLSVGIYTALCNLYLCAHEGADVLGRLENSLIGEHIAHVAIHADV